MIGVFGLVRSIRLTVRFTSFASALGPELKVMFLPQSPGSALEQTALDKMAESPLIEENIPTSMEVHTHQGHPFQVLHGPYKDPYKVVEYGAELGLGSREYELVDVFPVQDAAFGTREYISAN